MRTRTGQGKCWCYQSCCTGKVGSEVRPGGDTVLREDPTNGVSERSDLMSSSLFSEVPGVVCSVTETRRAGAHLGETSREYRLVPLCSQCVIDFPYVP